MKHITWFSLSFLMILAGAIFITALTDAVSAETVTCWHSDCSQDGLFCGPGQGFGTNCPNGGTCVADPFDCDFERGCFSEFAECFAAQTHKACDGNSCVTVSGGGSDKCSSNDDCTTPTHRACQFEACLTVPGGGPDTCSTHADCGATRKACVNNACGTVPQDGKDDACTTDSQCGHRACDGNVCKVVGGGGSDQCSSNKDCDSGPTNPAQPPTQPAISNLPSCATSTYTGKGTIAWGGQPNSTFGFWVDISTTSDFAAFSNKQVLTGRETNTAGFRGAFGGAVGPLALNPAIDYFVRVFNNNRPTPPTHSPTGSFNVPLCQYKTCINNACTFVPGVSPDECFSTADCATPSCAFTATPNRIVIPPPSQSTLEWACEDSIRCDLVGIGQVNSRQGTWVVSPTSTKTYVLTCQNQGEGGNTTTTVSTRVRVFSFVGGSLKEIRGQ